MSEARKKADWSIVAALVVLGLLFSSLGCYIGGYFLLSEPAVPAPRRTIRVFDAEWKARIYQPMAKIESFVLRRKVLLAHRP